MLVLYQKDQISTISEQLEYIIWDSVAYKIYHHVIRLHYCPGRFRLSRNLHHDDDIQFPVLIPMRSDQSIEYQNCLTRDKSSVKD